MTKTPPTVSAALMTRGPAARVAALLAVLRPVVDELVVALDDRAEPGVAATLAPLADQLLAYPYAEPVDRPLPWLHRHCGGDWLLTMDDDEVPSRTLLDTLRNLVAAEDVTHYWLPRRWLFPGAETYLDEPPWRPDYQLRLVLNDPRLLRFPDEVHWPIAAVGPARYADLPLYHADLLLKPLAEREQKADHYERLLPGKRVAGRPLNEAFYLPERLGTPRTAPVPEADLELVRSVLQAQAPAVGEAPVLRTAQRDEIDRYWEGRGLVESDYRANLEVVEPSRPVRAGETTTLEVTVENLGGAVWPWGQEGRPEIRLSYRWWSADGRVLAEGLRTPLPAFVRPGARELVPLAVQAPAEPGRHRLAIDLVHEHVRWFGCGADLEVEIVPRRRVAAIGPLEPAELGSLEPALEPLVFTPDPESLRGRWAGETAASADAYVLAGLPAGRIPAAFVLGLRTARLVFNASRVRRGRRPRVAREFLEALAKCESTVIARDGSRHRERAVSRASALSARALGLRVRLR